MLDSQELKPTLPVLLCKLDPLPIHHGSVGIARSLGKLGVPIFAVVDDRLTPLALSRYVKGVFAAPGPNSDRLIEEMATIGKKLDGSTIIIPIDDRSAVFVAEHANTLRNWFIFPRVPSGLPRQLADKASLYAFCRAKGVPCPEYLCSSSRKARGDFVKRVGFPLVVKSGEHGRPLRNGYTTVIVETANHLSALLEGGSYEHGKIIIQEYIDGEHWIFHGYCNPESDRFIGFTGRKLRSYPSRCGPTTLGVSIRNEAVIERAKALLQVTAYSGIMDLDYRFDPRDGEHKIIDFNPRVGANFRLFESIDEVDVVRALYLDLTGQQIHCGSVIEGKKLVAEPFDAASAFASWRRGELTLRGWRASLAGKKNRRGGMPAIRFRRSLCRCVFRCGLPQDVS